MTRSKICVPFVYKGQYNDVASEFDIRYVPGVNSGSKLLEFFDTFKDMPINVEFPKGIDIKSIEAFKMFDNVRVRVVKESDLSKIRDVSNVGVGFFLDERYSAVNWKQLDDQLSLGCNQIYVKDDLTHDLSSVYNICNTYGVGIRCVLNHVQSTGPYAGLKETDWFVRPEDMPYVYDIYSVFEFDCAYDNEKSEYEWNKFEALYRTFFDRCKYVGNMQELNFQLGFRLDNEACIDQYMSRSECGFACAHGSTCEKCRHIVELSKTMHEKGMSVN